MPALVFNRVALAVLKINGRRIIFFNRHDDYDQARTAEAVGPDGIMRAFTNAGIAFRFLRVVSLDYTKAMGACLSIAPSRLHSS